MGLRETFQVLGAARRADLAQEVCYAALQEPHGPIQQSAVRALLDTGQRGRALNLVRRYHALHRDAQKVFPDYRPLLRPILSETIRDPVTQSRINTLDILAQTGDPGGASIAAVAIDDASRTVADRAISALKVVARRHLAELEEFRAQPHRFSALALDQASQALAEALAKTMASYDSHHETVLVDLLIGLGDRAWWVVAKALKGTSEAARRAILAGLERTPDRSAVRILLRMLREPAFETLAARIFESQQGNAALGQSTAAVLTDLPQEEAGHLAALTRQVLWWPCVRTALPRLTPRETRRLIDFAAASKLTPAEKTAVLIDLAGHPAPETRVGVLGALKHLRAADGVERLGALASDPDEQVQMALLDAVLDLRPPSRAKILTDLIRSPFASVRHGAMQTFSRESLEKYLKNFDRLDEKQRELAIQAIAKIDPGMVDRLAEDVAALPPDRKLKVLKVIEYLNKSEQVEPALLELINDPDRKVRATVIRMVGLTGNPEALRALLHALTDPDRRIRANAIEAFEDIGDARLARILVPFTRDPDNRVRGNAVKALWQLGQRDVLQPLMEMLHDTDELMRMSAAWVLGEIDVPDAVELLRGAFRREENPQVKRRIEESLERVAPRRKEEK